MTTTDVAAQVAADELTLNELGYQRELARGFKTFDNFAISATIINVLAGVFSAFGFGMLAGGPRVLIFGWIAVSVLVLAVGAAMAEIASAYPTSGALYYASARLAKRNKAAWSWYTGWLNFAGQIGGTAATDFAAATFLQAWISMQWPSYTATLHKTVLIAAGLLVLHGLLNTFAVRTVGTINRISVWWLLGGVMIIAATLAFAPSHHQPLNYAGAFVNNTGFRNGLYGGLLGLLVTSWTYTGFDGSFHMSEETQGAATSAPKGITQSIRFSAIFGLVLVLALVYASQNWKTESSASVPPAQILVDAVGLTGAKLLLLFPVVALLFCGLANMTSNSRQIWAFSRDGAIPGSGLWHRLSPRTRTPVAAVWLAAGCAVVLTIPGWWNNTAFTAIVSVNVVGLFTAYGIPILLRLRLGDEFQAGPWNLGAKGRPIALLAVVWILLSNILFMLPQSSPITAHDFNYAPIALAVVLAIATVWWFVSARRTFHGPRSTITPEQAVIDPDLM
ncbi:amino acid permease [Actinospica sp.]|jgi:amino acid transporter|uniref:amino acid permease n=1 Tax=Actinospica sp. TaxID=1872142 RepID=UPI002B910C33|nr:amino acid permease [Actinospica sp.]HWG25392.1 amino acid permease [Actinospica sp.]